MKIYLEKNYPYIPCVLIVLFSLFYHINYWNIETSIAWDGLGYYLYLPTTFIYDDLLIKKYELYDSLIKKYELSTTFYQVAKSSNGNWIMKYTMGKSIMMFPFYQISDWFAQLFNYSRDGFSKPYQIGVFISGVVYLGLGGLIFTKLLIKVFKNKLTFLLSVIFFFGTNMYTMATMGICKVHVVLFFLYTSFLWYTVQWHEKRKTKHLILMGIIYGLMVSTRPTEGIAIIIPLLWGVQSWSDFKEKIKLINKEKTTFLLPIIIVALIISPQLIYWQILGGSWLITDYGNPAEGFDWSSPHILDALFSYRKGWLLYTPIMILGLIGIYWLYKSRSKWFLAILIFSILNIYVISSWSCWWYAQSFSNRGFSHSSLLLIIPVGVGIQTLSKSKIKYFINILILSFFVLNQFQSWQYSNSILDGSRMTKDYYWKIFGKTSITDEDKKLLSIDRMNLNEDENIPLPENRILTKKHFFDFEKPTEPNQNCEKSSFNGKYGDYIDSDKSFSESIQMPFNSITDKEHAWIKIKGKIKPMGNLTKQPFSLVSTFSHKGANYKYQAVNSEKKNWKKGVWNDFEFIYLTPEIRSKDDIFVFYLWNRGSSLTSIDDIEISVFEEK